MGGQHGSDGSDGGLSLHARKAMHDQEWQTALQTLPRSTHDTRVLDLRGATCPTTSLETLRALEAMPAGATIELVSDYYPARSTVPYHCGKRGYRYAFIESQPNDAPGVWRLRIQKA